MQDRGYFTVKGRRPSTSRPGLGSQHRSSSTRYAPSSARTEGHASTSTLGVHRRKSSRSVLSRSSAATHSSNASRVTEDPALQPDLNASSPFADTNLAIVITHTNTTLHPPHIDNDDLRRTQSMFTTDSGRHLVADAGVDVPVTQDQGMRRMRSQGGLSGVSRTRSSRTTRTRYDSVNVRDAIVGEVLAEEQVATARRVREELEEAERVAGPRSYWTGWMWRQVSNNPPQPSSSSQLGQLSPGRDEDEE